MKEKLQILAGIASQNFGLYYLPHRNLWKAEAHLESPYDDVHADVFAERDADPEEALNKLLRALDHSGYSITDDVDYGQWEELEAELDLWRQQCAYEDREHIDD